MMDKKSFLFVLLTIFFITPSVATAVPHYGDLPVITDDKSNELILKGDTIVIHNSQDTVVISRSDSGVSFNGAYLIGVDWENSDLTGLDADLLDGLQGDSYLKSDREDTYTASSLWFDNTAIYRINWSKSDDGAGSKLDSDLWDGQEYSFLDSDTDGEADDAENVTSTYKGNDIDGNSDGTVDNADNVESTYKSNDIDSDSDGKVNNSDLLDGKDSTDFTLKDGVDTKVDIYDNGSLIGEFVGINASTNLSVTDNGNTAKIEASGGSSSGEIEFTPTISMTELEPGNSSSNIYKTPSSDSWTVLAGGISDNNFNAPTNVVLAVKDRYGDTRATISSRRDESLNEDFLDNSIHMQLINNSSDTVNVTGFLEVRK